jgi:hypothetical protein
VFSIGPDFLFSLIELFMVNFFIIITANWSWSLYTNILITLLSVQNISFILTVTMNQGMLSRDPSAHSIEYLKKMAEKD